MDIVVIGSTFVRNEDRRQKRSQRGPEGSAKRVDRRRNRNDRRKGVRDGVVVRLSIPNDRRVNPDRRRSGSG